MLEAMLRLWVIPLLVLVAAAQAPRGATISGSVTDESGKPVENARIDHIGKMVVVTPPSRDTKSWPDEIRTDAEGRFRVVTHVPAFVVRKPGYESQRVLVAGDAQVAVTLRRIRATGRCTLAATPKFKTKRADDVDYIATWYYINTKHGPRGIISGSGLMYSLGAPVDSYVFSSVEYSEVMYASGEIDAAGRAADGTYWRERSAFGKAAQYFKQTREDAEQLNCVMDHIALGGR